MRCDENREKKESKEWNNIPYSSVTTNPLNKYLQSTCCISGTILDSRGSTANKNKALIPEPNCLGLNPSSAL